MANKDYFSSDVRELKNTIKDLRSKVRRLESDKRKLISEIQGYKKAFRSTIAELDERLINMPVEDVVRQVNKQQKRVKKESIKDAKKEAKELKDKWLCNTCNDGYLVIIKYRKASGVEWYHRSCSKPNCSNRTMAKKWSESVEGIEG